jgi:hypothetical protein
MYPMPWEDPATADAQASVQVQLCNAELFSRAMHGAALLYNLLVSERYETAALTTVNAPVDRYRGALHTWAEQAGDMTGWIAWACGTTSSPRTAGSPPTPPSGVSSTPGWMPQAGHAASAADHTELRALVGARERHVKRAQSRLVNDKLLRTWSGKSGSARLAYRWAQVA